MTNDGTKPTREAGANDEWLTPRRFALLLGLLVFAAFPGVLLGSTTFVFRDFGMFSYPVAYFHRECFWQGELPLWNPFNHCGVPFLAQWNTLVLYPGALVYLFLPLKWSLSLFCLAHLFWGGLGMYCLAHHWTHQRLAAGLAGVIFCFNGLSLTFLMWPSHVATFSWLPWVVWLGQRGWREGGQALVWATVAAAMQMLAGGPETILVTWLLLVVLAAGDWSIEQDLRWKLLWRFVGMGVLVALISAIQILPFLQLLAHSQRDTNYSATTHDWSMPLWGWANFLVPLFGTARMPHGGFLQIGQYWTTSYYAGVGTVLLAAIAVWRVRDWRVRALAALAAAGLILAFGDSTPFYRIVRFCFPGLGFVRYPIKFVILVLALAPLLAAFGLREMTAPTKPNGRLGKTVLAAMLVLIGAIVAFGFKFPAAEETWRATWQSGLSRAVLLGLAFLFLVALPGAAGRRRMLFASLLLVVIWLDLVTHSPSQNPGANPSIYTPGWARAELKLNPEPTLGGSRAMVSPEALEFLKYNPTADLNKTYLRNRLAIRVNCNLLDDLPQTDGFFSLVPREVSRVVALSYGHATNTFPALLDFLGVSQTTAPNKTCDWQARPSAMPLATAGQQPVFADDPTALDALSQTNIDFRQTVYLPLEARGVVSASRQSAARVLSAKFSNLETTLALEAPAASMLVVAQTHYPDWKAYVDGKPTRIWRANYAFQAVEISAGRHEVRLAYEDGTLQAGAALSGLGLAACAGYWLLSRARARRVRRRQNDWQALELSHLP